MMMKLALAADHGGYKLKTKLITYLTKLGYEITNLGTNSLDSVDYPDYGIALGEYIVNHNDTLGIAICGTGIGISIACNKVKNIRAALVYNVHTAKLASQHNHAHIICLGGRTTSFSQVKKMVLAFLNTKHEERHTIRLNKIEKYEAGGNNNG